LDKVLKQDREKVKDSLRKIFYSPTYEHAKEARAILEGIKMSKLGSAVA